AQQSVGVAADRRAGEQVVEEEEGRHLEQAGQAPGQRRHLLLGMQFHERLLELLGVLPVLLAQLGDLRLQPGRLYRLYACSCRNGYTRSARTASVSTGSSS